MSSPSMLLAEALLESFIPGYRFLAQFVSFYFSIDISSYLLIAVSLFAFWTYAAETLWGRIRSFLHVIATTAEIRYHDGLYKDAMRWISTQHDLVQVWQVVVGTKMNFSTHWNDED
ncbi:hypothetical protein BDV59DRAFT_67581 [Aspergillus ambiguus]|uniref:uncharacterized protein n=1 Tax=Aspergillus ambiguus TaxID=176160 RepID=UPI003CCCDCDC